MRSISTWLPRTATILGAAVLISLACPTVGPADRGDCGQPTSNGPMPTATDCLFILQTAVGITTCAPVTCICAPSGTLPVTASDSLVCLTVAIGAPGMLNCPCPMATTTTTMGLTMPPVWAP